MGGTNPSLFGFYRWKEKTADGKRLQCPEEVLSFPGILEKIIPSGLFPDELKKGLGDGLVTAESSRLDWADEHHNFPLNHARMLYDKRVRETIISFIEARHKVQATVLHVAFNASRGTRIRRNVLPFLILRRILCPLPDDLSEHPGK